MNPSKQTSTESMAVEIEHNSDVLACCGTVLQYMNGTGENASIDYLAHHISIVLYVAAMLALVCFPPACQAV